MFHRLFGVSAMIALYCTCSEVSGATNIHASLHGLHVTGAGVEKHTGKAMEWFRSEEQIFILFLFFGSSEVKFMTP